MIRTKPLCPRERLLPNWQVFWLTPIPKAFPIYILIYQWRKCFRNVWNRASQQRDCSGITPDSLLIRMPERAYGTNSDAKVWNHANIRLASVRIIIRILIYSLLNALLFYKSRRGLYKSRRGFYKPRRGLYRPRWKLRNRCWCNSLYI